MPLSNTSKILIKPVEGSFDSGFEVIGTKSGFMVAWTRGTSAFSNEVLCQRFDSNGKEIGKPISLDGPRMLEGAPELTDLGGGKIGVLWKATSDAFALQLKAAVVDAATGKAGPTVVAIPERAASAIHDIAVLDNGKVALVTRTAPGAFDENTMLQLLDKDMKPVGQPIMIEDDTPGPLGIASFEQTVVANGKGGVAFFRGSDSQLKAVTFDGSGKAGKPVQVNTTEMAAADFSSYALFNVKAEPLDGGGFVVTWMNKDSDLNYDVYARVYGENGKPLGKDFVVNQEVAGNQEAPEILTFDKGFAIAWTEMAFSASLVEAHVMRFFDEKGRAVSDDIVTEDFASGDLRLVGRNTEYAQLADGSYVKIYDGVGGAITVDGVAAPRFGTGKSDTINGKAGDEIILGGAGKDKLAGSDGNDTLDGGADDDRLEGGAGDDVMQGGAGDDLLIGGKGSDIFVFAPKGGKDEVTKFDADDFLDVRALHYDSASDVIEAARQVGKNVVFTLKDQLDDDAGGVVVKLINVKLADVSEAAILF